MSDEQATEVDAGRVARAFLEAVFAGDPETACAYSSPGLTLRIEGQGTVEGHAGLREIMDLSAEVCSDMDMRIHHVLAAGETAAINRTTRVTVNGKRLTVEVGAFFTVRDGLVCEWTDYQDAQALLRALGH
ncbi:nuclear transport factor 2 family protein [Dietzia sp. E1]|uniref:nuclear transport factor 2 family protein n=1 Tax=Dietzia sp. E1 TaxID=328361 RepID=UPI0015FE6AD9|nr:nuclear transport factor 2 family protein [Dietzia sp. E1]MBB1021317.1 nuclear transport factor 2 family protein [Dietzia sp. E1]